MYFHDLSSYAYGLPEALPGVRSVGWLDAAHSYDIGPVPSEVIRKLTVLAIQKSVNQMRGYHYCEFCSEERIFVVAEGKKDVLGTAEIWLPDARGGLFASPDLIVHYIDAHQYRPPQEYVEAVQALDLSAWNPPPEYARILGLASR